MFNDVQFCIKMKKKKIEYNLNLDWKLRKESAIM